MDLMTKEPQTTVGKLEQWAREVSSDPDSYVFYYGIPEYPPVRISSDEHNVYVRAEAPGMKLSDFDIQVTGRNMRIHGVKDIDYEGCVCCNCLERPAGEFSRLIYIPKDIDHEKIKATYNLGVLTITLPKKEEARPRTINVKKG